MGIKNNASRLTGKICLVLVSFVFLVFFWLSIYSNGLVDTNLNYFFGLIISVIPFFSGIGSIMISKKWGGLGSVIGRAIIFFSIGLITWSIGTMVFAYYNLFLSVEVPYPSVADVVYILSTPFWAIGILYLSKATGVIASLKTFKGKVILILIPLIIGIISYYLLFIFARGGEIDVNDGLKGFFDILYPLEDIILLTLTTLIYSLSYNYLGGRYKLPCLVIMLGFALNYFADFSFAYTTTTATYYVANWVDLLFAVAMFFLSIGLLSFDVSLIQKEK